MGGILALTGALLLTVVSVPMLTPHTDSALADEVVVGTDGCYTCHIDVNSLWSDALTPRMIEDAIINPHAVAPTDALPIGAEGDSLSYRVSNIDVSLSPNYRFGTVQGSTP